MPSFQNRINAIILWTDLAVVSVSFLITCLIFRDHNASYFSIIDVILYFFLIGGWFFTAKNYDLYEEAARRGLMTDIFKTGKNILFQAVLIALFLFIVKQPNYNRKFAAIYIGLLSFLLPLQKLLYKKVLIFFINIGVKMRRVLIVGAGNVGMDFYDALSSNAHLGYEVVGFLDDSPKPLLNGKHLGSVDNIKELLEQYHDIDEVVVALPNAASDKIGRVVMAAKNEAVRVKIIPDYFHYFSARYGISMLQGLPMISIRKEPLEEFHWRAVKRLFDVMFSLLVLIFVCSWLFPVLALLIKLESPGPVFFTQLRSGRNKIPFKCYKFRSMRVNSEANLLQASKNDSRFTRIGSFLRKSSLDEFPQFFNVLKGEMSIVGPRPHMIKHTEEYSRMIDRYLVRHLLKAGITGWAQVNGLRGETRHPREMQARVEHDVFYLENWSLFFDIKIIFLTVWNVVKGDKKAY